MEQSDWSDYYHHSTSLLIYLQLTNLTKCAGIGAQETTYTTTKADDPK